MSQNVNVMVRLRPLLKFEQEAAWMIRNNTMVALNNHSRVKMSSAQKTFKGSQQKQIKEIDQEFPFEQIISQTTTSEQLYKKHVRQTFVDCYQHSKNMSILAYGQTCSGKTHTILGVKQFPGIIPCVLREIFKIATSKDKNSRFKVSYLELYNEKLTDLLGKGQKQCKIVKDSKWGYDVSNTLKENISGFQEGVRIVERGEKERSYGVGQHHSGSSRSHTIFRVFVEEWNANFDSSSFVITIVDLAGSERLESLNKNNYQTGFINKSLFQLANVISKLSQDAPHIPFRDSKLTRLLQPSLSGSGRTILICCVSPSTNCFGQTLSTLRLATRAKKITLPEQPLISPGDQLQHIQHKLFLKTKECNKLMKQLNEVNRRLQQKQKELAELKKTKAQSQKKCDMLVLLDHENFTLFLEDPLTQVDLSSPKFTSLKENFVNHIQQLYESYTQSILELYKGDSFAWKIEEVCFMNMVLEHDKIIEYKISVIEEIIREKQDKRVKQNQQFYEALQQYQQKLINKFQANKSECSIQWESNRKQRELMPKLQYNSQQKQIEHPPTLDMKRQNKAGSTIFTWGSKKDYRVPKGQLCQLNMTKISSIKNIVSVSCGYHHTLTVTQQGKVYGWGKNTERQLSSSSRQSISSPIQVSLQQSIQSVAAGWGHSIAVSISGRAYSWGYGKDGQLGIGLNQNQVTPTLISHPHKITQVFAGHSHSAFLDVFQDCYTFGFNQDYRLLSGQQRSVTLPKRIPIRDVKAVGLGVSHSAIVTNAGLVFCGGVGTNGQLGVILNENQTGWQKLEVPDRQFESEPFEKICPLVQVDLFGQTNKASSVQCGENSTFVLTESGQLYSFGKTLGGRIGHKNLLPTKILDNVDSVTTGARHSFAFNEQQNKLYSWGFNLYGQANPSISGDITTPQIIQQLSQGDITALSCGFFHSIIVIP